MVTPPSAPRKKGRRDYEIINFPKIFQKNSKLGEKKREGGGGRREEEMTPFFYLTNHLPPSFSRKK